MISRTDPMIFLGIVLQRDGGIVVQLVGKCGLSVCLVVGVGHDLRLCRLSRCAVHVSHCHGLVCIAVSRGHGLIPGQVVGRY